MTESHAGDNKFLTVRPGVIITPVMEPVICALDGWFQKYDHRALVTSGKRDPEGQLTIIRKYAHLNAIDQEFSGILTAKLEGKVDWKRSPELNVDEVYEWQPAWSRLLNHGIIISPPIDAVALFDYYNPRHPEHNKKGELIKATEHYCMSDVHPFDIGGATNGIKDELIIVAAACNSKTIPGLLDYLAEHDNNAVHTRCTLIGRQAA